MARSIAPRWRPQGSILTPLTGNVRAATASLLALALAVLCVAGCGVYGQRSLYVANGGSDTAAGTTPVTAWRTLERLANETLADGDTVRHGTLAADTPVHTHTHNSTRTATAILASISHGRHAGGRCAGASRYGDMHTHIRWCEDTRFTTNFTVAPV